MKPKFFGLIAAGLIVLLAMNHGANAAPDEGIHYFYENGRVVLETGNVTLTVNTMSHEPIFHYAFNDVEYTVIFKQLMEYIDENGDGAFQYNETVPSLPVLTLTSVDWDFSGFQTEESEGVTTAVHFNFTVANVNGVFYKDLDMTIAAHLYLADQEIVDGYTVEGGYELKFDIIIVQFPWMREETSLALRFDISPAKESQMNDPNDNTIDPHNNTTGNEMKVQNRNRVKNRFELRFQNGSGYFAYANYSEIRNGTTSEYSQSPVNASYCTDGLGNVRVFLTFEHADDIIYDPSIGATLENTGDTNTDENTNAIPLGITGVVIAVLTSGLVGIAYKKK